MKNKIILFFCIILIFCSMASATSVMHIKTNSTNPKVEITTMSAESPDTVYGGLGADIRVASGNSWTSLMQWSLNESIPPNMTIVSGNFSGYTTLIGAGNTSGSCYLSTEDFEQKTETWNTWCSGDHGDSSPCISDELFHIPDGLSVDTHYNLSMKPSVLQDLYEDNTKINIYCISLANGTSTDGTRFDDQNGTYTPSLMIEYSPKAITNYTVGIEKGAIEGEAYKYFLNVTYYNLTEFISSLSATVHYFGEVYDMTSSLITGGKYGFESENVVTPFTDSVSLLYNITINYANGSIGYETTGNFTQTISSVSFYDCYGKTNATSVMVLNFTLWDEYADTMFNDSYISNSSDFDIDLDMHYYLDDSSQYKNLSITANNVTNLTICMSPADISYNHTTIVDYGATTYDRRQYHFYRDNIDNVTDNIHLYLLEVPKATSTTITIEDNNGQALENYIVDIKKYFIGTDTHKTIGMLKTNVDGKDHIYLQHNEPFYKFIIRDTSGEIVHTTGDTKITSGTVTLTVGATSWGEEVSEIEGIYVSTQFDNTTRTFTLTYAAESTDFDKICMKVTQERRSGTEELTTKCSETSSGTLTYTVTDTGLYVLSSWIEVDGTLYPLESLTQDDRKTYNEVVGTDGLFMALLIILIISFALIWSPMAAILGSIIGIVIAFFFGFINLGIGAIIGLIIVGIMMMVKLKW